MRREHRAGLLLAGLIFAAAAHSQSAEISLTVTAVSARAEGQVLFALFDSEKTHLKEPAMKAMVEFEADGTATHVFEQLAAGAYSVSAVQDIDKDGELDTNFLGIPKEPVALSNDAKGRFGPPSWKDSAIELDQSLAITIELTKYK